MTHPMAEKLRRIVESAHPEWTSAESVLDAASELDRLNDIVERLPIWIDVYEASDLTGLSLKWVKSQICAGSVRSFRDKRIKVVRSHILHAAAEAAKETPNDA